MFDLFAKALSSIASFLFPVFASYKALRTSDPAQLTPWLMYWVVLACALLVESWVDWFLVWIPFYAYMRLFFLLYLVLPQTQGARIIYQTHVHPWLEENESQIDDFIASAHDRLRTAGIAYLKRAIEVLRTAVLGYPPAEPEPAAAPAAAQPQTYTQALLARFSLPSARWSGNTGAGPASGSDFYSLLAGAVSAAAGAAGGAPLHAREASTAALIPPGVRDSERASFIATQRERLGALLSALDREAAQLQQGQGQGQNTDKDSLNLDKDGQPRFGNPWAAAAGDGASGASSSRPPSGASGGGLTKSRSEADFEKIDAESGAEEDDEGGLRRRTPGAASASPGGTTTGGSWMPWGWGRSTGVEKE